MVLLDEGYSRLRAALGARGLAARLAASHFESVWGGGLVWVRRSGSWKLMDVVGIDVVNGGWSRW